jgi:transposase InsO family protein
VRYAFIQEHASHWPVPLLCQVLQVSRSGYYGFLAQVPSARQQWRCEIKAQIRRVYQASDGVYGSPRIYRQLRKEGLCCNVKTVAKLMQEEDLAARNRRRYTVQTTDSQHGYPVAPNRLEQCFAAEGPNQVWTADLTYIPTGEGWLYLAVEMDLYSRKIVGWSMADHLRAELPLAALEMAVARRRPGAGLIHHSDRGVQYACDAFQEQLSELKLQCSMSRRGNCYDNAVTESFFGTLKQELVYRRTFATRREAKAAIFRYIEIFYNRSRMHSTLGYVSPEVFEAMLN